MALDPTRITSLRSFVSTNYLDDGAPGGKAFSGAEVEDFITKLADVSGGITGRGRANALRIRDEFAARGAISDSALERFDRALGKAVGASPHLTAAPTRPDGTGSVADIRAGDVPPPLPNKSIDVMAWVKSQFLTRGDHDIVSAREVDKLVGAVAQGGLTLRRLRQLETVRRTLDADKLLSPAASKAFDRALERAIEASPEVTPADLTPNGEHAKGLELSHLPTVFNLAEVPDPAVREVLGRGDFNNDGVINDRDRVKAGMSTDQWNGFMLATMLHGAANPDPAPIGDLQGKKISFSAVPDKAAAKRWAESMGATVVDDVAQGVDFLVVGNKRSTGKDERAVLLNLVNAPGDKDIAITDWRTFIGVANGAANAGQLPAEIESAMIETFWDWQGTPQVAIENVRGNDVDGYQFDYSAGQSNGTAYAIRHEGEWILAPKPITAEVVDAAVTAMQAHFDEYVVPDLRSYGSVTNAEIQEMRDSIGARRAYFPHESSDPYSLTSDYDLVFAMSNPTGSDHGYFVGIDIANLASNEAYTFN